MSYNNEILVVIQCITYNHENYIEDCLKGFVIQKTSFNFVAIVHDDASTDNTADIVRKYEKKYPNIIHGIYETENQYSKGIEILNRIINNACMATGARYIALCEGDDYWIDPYKLQKQVDFMETHEDYSMCFHKVNVIGDLTGRQIFANLKNKDYSARQIYSEWTVPTCSVLYRNGYVLEYNPSVIFGDIFLYLQLSESGRLRCLDFVGGVYRRHKEGVSNSDDVQVYIKLYYQYLFFEKRFPDLRDISRIKQEDQGLKCIIHAPYFKGIWKYRFLYMLRHPKLFFSSFFTTTILSYTPLKNHKFWKKIC